MCIPGIFNNGRFMNMTYDMIHGGLAGSMNLMFNQNFEHSMTFPTLYTMPNNIFNFSPYGTIGSNNYLLDPTFPIFQSQFGMGGNFGGYGMPMMPWMNPEMMKKMWSFDGTDSTSSSTDPTTRKYNKMLSLLRNIANSDEVKQTVKDQINDAIRNCKGKTEEKLEKLTEIYEKLDKEVVKNALKEANNIGYAKQSTSEKDSFRANLEAIGFEYGNGEIDKLLNKLHTDIKEIKSDGSVTGPSLAGAVNEDNILDYISSWNTKYADYENDSDKRILSHIAEYYNSMSDGEGTVRSNLINPLVDALKNKADDVKTDLPKEEKAKIEKAIKELDSSWGNGDEISEEMIEAFDKLYVLVRMAALANFNEEVIGYYGELDEDLFNEELFTKETIEDLKAEGFSKSAIEEANENVEVSDDEDDADGTSTDETESSSTSSTTPLTSGQVERAYELGKTLFEDLNGWTSDNDWANIKVTLKSINESNVLEVIRQFNYSSDNCGSSMSWQNIFGTGHTECFFEWVSREDEGNKAETQKTVLQYVIKRAEAKQKSASAELKAEYKDYIKDLKTYMNEIGTEGLSKSSAIYVDKIIKKLIDLEEKPAVELNAKSSGDTWGSIGGCAAVGATIGACVGGPIGAAIGGGIGAAVGWVSSWF